MTEKSLQMAAEEGISIERQRCKQNVREATRGTVGGQQFFRKSIFKKKERVKVVHNLKGNFFRCVCFGLFVLKLSKPK